MEGLTRNVGIVNENAIWKPEQGQEGRRRGEECPDNKYAIYKTYETI